MTQRGTTLAELVVALVDERLAALDKEIAQAMLRWEELEARSAGA